MGKQGVSRSLRPESQSDGMSLGMKDYQIRCCSENFCGNNPSIGRRLSGDDVNSGLKTVSVHGLKHDVSKISASKGSYGSKRNVWLQKHVRSILFMIGVIGFVFLVDSLTVSLVNLIIRRNTSPARKSIGIKVKCRNVSRFNWVGSSFLNMALIHILICLDPSYSLPMILVKV